MGVGVAVGGIGVFVEDGTEEGGIAVGGATVGATVRGPQATSKLSNMAMVKRVAKRGLKNSSYLGSIDRISPSLCLCPEMVRDA